MAQPVRLGNAGATKSRVWSVIPIAATMRDRALDGPTFLFGGFMIAGAVAQLYLMLMSRLLPTTEYGTVVALTSLSYFLAVLARTIQGWVIKAVADARGAGFGEIYSLYELAMRVILPIGGVVLAADWLGRDWIAGFLHLDSTAPVIALGLYAFAALLIPIPVGILLGLGRMRLAGAIIILEALFRLVVGTRLVSAGLGADGALFGYAAGTFLAFAVGLVPLFPVLVSGHGSPATITGFGGLGRFTLLGLLINGCLIFTSSIDQIAVKHYFSAEVAGQFGVAFLLGQIIAMVTMSLSWVVFSKSATMGSEDPGRPRLLVRSLLVVGGFSAVLTLAYLIVPNLAILVMGGARYSAASAYLGLEGMEMTLFALVYVQVYYHMSVGRMQSAWLLIGAVAAEMVLAVLHHQTVQGYLLTHLLVLAGLLASVSSLSLWHFRAEVKPFVWGWPGWAHQSLLLVLPEELRLRLLGWRPVYTKLIRGAVGGASILLVGVSMAWLVLNTPGYWAFVAAVLFGLAVASRAHVDRHSFALQLLAVLVTVSALDYFAWRAQVINWQAWYLSVPLFAAELFGAIHTVGLQYTVWPLKVPLLEASEDPTKRPIFVFIPTVNEGPAVLKPTIQGALAARTDYLRVYPHGIVTIVVCNDGLVAHAPNWREVEVLAEGLGVRCITRTEPGGAKAGNIEHARKVVGAVRDALIVIFDADQVAAPDFFLRTVSALADPHVGWVQTPQYYRNVANPVAKWANDQQQLFYRILCPQKSAVNAAFICGTNVMIRAAALDEIGGLPQDSITEDFKASIELHPRWRGVFVNRVMATGLGPEDLQSYFKQQNRWASGTLQVLRSHWRSIFLPRHGGLQPGQRFQYFLACTHYLSGVRDLIYLLTPLAFLLTGIPTIWGSDFATYVSHFLPFYLVSQIAFWYVARGKTSPRGILIGFGSFSVLAISALSVITGRRIRFAVTPKQRSAEHDFQQVLPHALLVVAYAVALPIAWLSHRPHDTLLLNTVWTIYNMFVLLAMVWLGSGLQSDALAHTFRWWPRPLVSAVASGRTFALSTWHSERRLLVSAVASTMIVIGLSAVAIPPALSSPAIPFEPRTEVGHPRIGVYLPVEFLQNRQATLQRDLGESFQIVERTQDIGDTFDAQWAQRLRANGGRPWITLLFDKSGKPAYYSSLPAIANGLYDDALRRWAHAVRAYGHPVYLTILPQVDRNWAATSAVANGGVPQDVARAWQRVRSVFQIEGATNVAWVWAPADPINDSQYAPPLASIDLVQFTMIGGYKGQADLWPDPAPVLEQLAQHYPSTPLIIEVYAAGAPEEKAGWLREVGSAVAATPNIYALVYHEGSPDPQATLAEHAPWSMASDPRSLAAMRDAFALVARSSRETAARTVVPAPPTPVPATPIPATSVPKVVATATPQPPSPTKAPAPTPTQQPEARPQAAPTPAKPLSAAPAPTQSLGLDGLPLPRVYAVQPGDTLKSIAVRIYGDPGALSSFTLSDGQPIKDPNNLYLGEKLMLPKR